MFELSTPVAGSGQLALIGGGEFSFGETAAADSLWTDAASPGRVGFLPTASGSADYGSHFATYLEEGCDREVETVPVYRPRDARRQKNVSRLAQCAAIYVGGGIADQLTETLLGSPVLDAIEERLRSGATIVAIAAAAQAAGAWMRSLAGREVLPGLGWLKEAVVEANFSPNHDHRLRQLMARPGVRLGVGLPAGACLLVSGDGTVTLAGSAFVLDGADCDLKLLSSEDAAQ